MKQFRRIRRFALYGLIPIFGILWSAHQMNADVKGRVIAYIQRMQIQSKSDEVWVIKQEGKAERAYEGMPLRAGDLVRNDSAAAVTVYYPIPSKPTREIKKGEEHLVVAQEGESKSEKIAELIRSVWDYVWGMEQVELVAVPQGRFNLEREDPDNPVFLIAPRGEVLTENPTFYWKGEKHLKYSLRLLEKNSGNVLFEMKELQQTEFPYPADVPRLIFGISYEWEVQLMPFPPKRATFERLNESDSEEVNGKLAFFTDPMWKSHPEQTLDLLRAGILLEKSLYADAREILTQAAKLDPQNPVPHMILKTVYEKQSMMDLAQSEEDLAQRLKKE